MAAKPDSCPVCGSLFKRKYSRGKQRKIYCSKACRYKVNNEAVACKTCGKDFTRNRLHKAQRKEFCSLACIQRRPCLLCGKTITGRNTFRSGKKTYCGRKCASVVNRCLKAKTAYRARGFAATIKRLGELRCESCNVHEIAVLVVHHLDKDRRNNSFDNLQTLCANCHAREHWHTSSSRDADLETAMLLSTLAEA